MAIPRGAREDLSNSLRFGRSELRVSAASGFEVSALSVVGLSGLSASGGDDAVRYEAVRLCGFEIRASRSLIDFRWDMMGLCLLR